MQNAVRMERNALDRTSSTTGPVKSYADRLAAARVQERPRHPCETDRARPSTAAPAQRSRLCASESIETAQLAHRRLSASASIEPQVVSCPEGYVNRLALHSPRLETWTRFRRGTLPVDRSAPRLHFAGRRKLVPRSCRGSGRAPPLALPDALENLLTDSAVGISHGQRTHLRRNPPNRVLIQVGQAEVPAAEAVGQVPVVEAQQVSMVVWRSHTV